MILCYYNVTIGTWYSSYILCRYCRYSSVDLPYMGILYCISNIYIDVSIGS